MNDHTNEVLNILNAPEDAPICKEQVLTWIQSRNLRTWGAVYELTRVAWSRITPSLSGDEACSFIADYLFECILRHPVSEDYLHTGFEAGRELSAWVKHLKSRGDSEELILVIVQRLKNAYLSSHAETRNRIETGALEHIFEERKLRKYFSDWELHPELQQSYKFALAWGKAHQ